MIEPVPKDLLAQRIDTWYSRVSIDLSGDLLAARQKAIERMANSLTLGAACNVVAYAHGQTQFGGGLIQWITKHGQATDESFSPKATGREPKVMTACAIAHRLATDPTSPVSVTHGLLVHCAAFRGYRTSAHSQNLAGIASRQLAFAAEKATELPAESKTSAVEKINAAFKDLPEAPNAGGEGSALADWLVSLRSATENLASRHDSTQRALARTSKAARQSLDQIAWLLEDWCELAARPWKEVKDAAPVVVGAELASLTQTPDLQQVDVMLRSALRKADRDVDHGMSSVTAVQRAAASIDVWPAGHGHLLLPLSASVDAWREKGNGGSGWRELAKSKRGGGDPGNKTEAAIADQAFREFIISRSIEDDRD